MEPTLTVKILSPRIGTSIPAPAYATDGAAAFDLAACCDAPITLAPGDMAALPTGIAVAVPPGFVGLVFARSGLGIKHGITLSNGVGVIDSDYRGEICVGLTNVSRAPYTINPGDRIAQLMLAQAPQARIIFGELDDTGRGAGGLGSTGR